MKKNISIAVKTCHWPGAWILVMGLAVFTKIASAQQAFFEEMLLEQLHTEQEMDDAPALNNIRILQLGENNRAITGQDGAGALSGQNILSVLQAGSDNEIQMYQLGAGNTSVAIQYGDDNEYGLELQGDDNKTSAYQLGDQNRIEQHLTGNNKDYSVYQEGTYNELIQVENNPEMPAYEIQQRGSGMSVRIENTSINYTHP